MNGGGYDGITIWQMFVPVVACKRNNQTRDACVERKKQGVIRFLLAVVCRFTYEMNNST